MKTELFKKLIKEAVKEAFNEELKHILLEAVKNSSRNETSQSSFNQPLPPPQSPSYGTDQGAVRNKYTNFLKENFTFTTNDVNVPSTPFRPLASTDTVNGSLPPGEVSMDQILGLMNPQTK